MTVKIHPRRGNGWLRVGLMVLVVGLIAYRGWKESRQLAPAPAPSVAEAIDDTPLQEAAKEESGPEKSVPRPAKPTTIRNQTIREQDGEIAFRGDIELAATLARIERGEQLRFANDGSVFQNRERRLPRREGGYYREWVHPTPGLSGPGPQRIVTGADGEIYYTPDHYRTFQRVDRP